MTKLEKSLQLLSFEPDELFSGLEENEKKEFCSWCSTVFKNHWFSKIFNEINTKEIVDTIAKLEDRDLALEGKGKIIGIAGVNEMFQNYHLQHMENIRKDAPMTDEEKQEII